MVAVLFVYRRRRSRIQALIVGKQGKAASRLVCSCECSSWFPAGHQPPVGRLSVNQLCIMRLALSSDAKKMREKLYVSFMLDTPKKK
jgi:hypothetical protein